MDSEACCAGADPQGKSGSDTVSIDVVDPPAIPPPTVQILRPDPEGIFGLSEVDFEGTATDPSGTTDLEFRWFVSMKFQPDSERELIGTTPTFSWAPGDFIEDPCGTSGGTLTIKLEVTNPDGAVGTDQVDMRVLVIC